MGHIAWMRRDWVEAERLLRESLESPHERIDNMGDFARFLAEVLAGVLAGVLTGVLAHAPGAGASRQGRSLPVDDRGLPRDHCPPVC